MIAEKLFEAPIMLEFNSELRDGKYYRQGTDIEFYDAIYRIYVSSNLSELNKEEKLKLVQKYYNKRNTKDYIPRSKDFSQTINMFDSLPLNEKITFLMDMKDILVKSNQIVEVSKYIDIT